jgi:hypothetical protein
MLRLIEFLERICSEWRNEQAGKNAGTARITRLIGRFEKLEARVEALELKDGQS